MEEQIIAVCLVEGSSHSNGTTSRREAHAKVQTATLNPSTAECLTNSNREPVLRPRPHPKCCGQMEEDFNTREATFLARYQIPADIAEAITATA